MSRMLTSTTLIARAPDIIATEMDGEVAMLSVEQGRYYGISGIGCFVWDQLAQPISMETLCRRVLDEYEIDEAICRTDLEELVADLLEQKIAYLTDAEQV